MSKLDQKNISKLVHHFSHDMKNILHNIYGFAQLLDDEFEPTYVERIMKLVMKCKDLINEYVVIVDSGDFTIPTSS